MAASAARISIHWHLRRLPPARFGNAGAYSMRGPGEVNMDLGLPAPIPSQGPVQHSVPRGSVQLHQHAAFRQSRRQCLQCGEERRRGQRSRRFCASAVGCQHRPRRHRRTPVPLHAARQFLDFAERTDPVYTASNSRRRESPRMRTLRWICFSSSLLAIAWGQEPARTNPFDNSDGVAQGRALFQIHCSYCHGANGEGGRGADLTTGRYRRGGSDANLYISVRNGIPGTEMPAVRATDDEVWKMVAFVKRLGSAVPIEKAPGDGAAGKLIFEGKGKCMTCHAVGPDGGSLGPDLSDVGRRRSPIISPSPSPSPDADVSDPVSLPRGRDDHRPDRLRNPAERGRHLHSVARYRATICGRSSRATSASCGAAGRR